MPEYLELPYCPKRSIIWGAISFFAVTAAVLGYVSLTEEWTPGSTAMLRVTTAVSALGFLMCAAFVAILLRSRHWRLRVDAQGVSIDTLFGRRSVAWNELQSAQISGEGLARGLMVTGTKSSLAINAMLMSDPSQFELVFSVVQQQVPADASRRS